MSGSAKISSSSRIRVLNFYDLQTFNFVIGMNSDLCRESWGDIFVRRLALPLYIDMSSLVTTTRRELFLCLLLLNKDEIILNFLKESFT